MPYTRAGLAQESGMWMAVQSGDVTAVEQLCRDQPLLAINPISLDIDAPGTVADAGSTARYPLALATDLNHTSVVHALMFASINNSKTYNADYEESYRAALLTACTNGNSDLTLLIVRVMPSLINIQANKIGLTPLILAIQGGHIATMDVLISA
eukprot:gene28466-20063_t